VHGGNVTDWRYDAQCGDAQNKGIDFFSERVGQQKKALALCATCPVRRECLVDALTTETVWGTWGGKRETELRQALMVDENGETFDWGITPTCPYCSSTALDVSRKRRVRVHVTCEGCGLSWDRRRIIRPRQKSVNAIPSQRDSDVETAVPADHRA
jgi:WhiB family redox-sensing transcriptional regulator